MRIFFDQRQADHAPLRELNNGEWMPYAESADRVHSIAHECGDPQPARDFGIDPILAVHDADYVAFLRTAHERWRAAGRAGDAIGYTFPVAPRRPLALERVDARNCWAGVAHTSARRIKDIADFPPDYDFQSTLLRAIVQAGAEQVTLSAGAVRAGHGVEREGAALASRSNAVLAALTERRTSWADRQVFTRVARWVLPKVVEKGIPAWLLMAGGALTGAGAVALIAFGFAWGAGVAIPGVAALATGAALSALRGEEKSALMQEALIGAIVGAVVGALGLIEMRLDKTLDGVILALVTIAATAIAERSQAVIRRWWGSPAAYLLLVTPFAIAGRVSWGLAVIAIYAFVTLAAAVESRREKP